MSLYLATLAQQSAEPELSGQLGTGRIADIVLAQIAMELIGEVEKAIIQ